ncbi:MAG: RNA polymerase sigma factor [Myxococcota bacterium]
MDALADGELVSRLRSGDVRAFDLAYNRYHQRLFGFMLRMVHRRDVAEDLSQEAWSRLARGARELRDGDRLAPWLFRVARNLACSRERRLSVERDAATLITELELERSPKDPHESAVSAALMRDLELGLAALPPRDRELILLVGVESLRPQEAAEVLGISPEALRKRLERAREKLRAAMAKLGSEES